jgi:1,2-phenylacetyl-CoA epoxidase catalytic subunit
MPSKTKDAKMAIAAISNWWFIALTMAKKPQNKAAVVNALGSK